LSADKRSRTCQLVQSADLPTLVYPTMAALGRGQALTLFALRRPAQANQLEIAF
jgi:hypothetical protein